MAEYLRRVIREHRFERELRALIANAITADQFVEAAEFLLARAPEIGFQLEPGSPIWFLPMAPIEEAQVSLYYTFDDSTVCSFRSREFSQPRTPWGAQSTPSRGLNQEGLPSGLEALRAGSAPASGELLFAH